MMKVKIKAKLEISDHDGYCSGADCEYSYLIKEYIVDIPNIENYIDDVWIKEYVDMPNIKTDCGICWTDYLPIPDINNYGSYYCETSKECDMHDLDKHSYKYTIIKLTVLELGQ